MARLSKASEKRNNYSGFRDARFIKTEEKRLVGRLNRVFKAQMAYVAQEIKKLRVFQFEKMRFNAVQDDPEIDALLRNMPGKEDMVDSIDISVKSSVTRGGKRLVSKLKLGKLGMTFNLNHPHAIKFLSDKKKFQLSEASGTITGTTKRGIKSVLVNAISQGKSYQETAELIRKQAEEGVLSRARSELIAIQEVGQAYGEGEYTVATDFRLKHPSRQMLKRWITVGDEQVRDTHKRNEDDGWIEVELLHSGTRETVAPSEDFRCRCAEEYKIE